MSFRLTVFLVVAVFAYLGMLVVYYLPLPGGRPLDFFLAPGPLREALVQYTEADVGRHRFGTRILDRIFPVLYTGVILLVLWRGGQGAAVWGLSAMTLLGCGVDYFENGSNLRLLAGDDEARFHVALTWMKFLLLLPPVGYGLLLLGREWRGGAHHTGS